MARDIEQEMKRLEGAAEKVLSGFECGNLTNKEMGFERAEYQSVWRRMMNDGYKGSLAFYIMDKCEELVDAAMDMHQKSHGVATSKMGMLELYEQGVVDKAFLKKFGLDIEKLTPDDIEEIKRMAAKEKEREKDFFAAFPDAVVRCAQIKKMQVFTRKQMTKMEILEKYIPK